jgi:MEDS: MEthanogen/methylotroph, DcmR Sensory domain
MSSRRAGAVAGPVGYRVSDHVCWIYEHGRAGWVAAAVRFLLDGASCGQRLLYVADGDRAGLLADLDALDGRDRLLATGQLMVMPLDEIDASAGQFDRGSRLAAFRGWAREAVAAGYPALRLAADPSSLVESATDVAAFAGFEVLFDELVATEPMVAMCGYDRRRLSTDTTTLLGFVHPLRHRPAAPTALAVPAVEGLHADGAGGWNVVGPLDFSCAAHWATALSALPDTGDIHLHMERLRFADAAATRVLLAKAATAYPQGRLLLHDSPYLLRRTLDVGWPGDNPGLVLLPPCPTDLRPPDAPTN